MYLAENSTGSVTSSCYVKVHLRIRPILEQQVAVEPMETIVEVSEHSRTTSADSHRTEQVNEYGMLYNLRN